MAVIKDTGKVWIKGSVGTIHAVRIDDKIFATGKKEGQNIELWIKDKGLCLDLHNSNKGERTARFIPLDIKPTLSGTLFNGFVKTKHADVLIVASDGNQTKEISVSGKEYQDGEVKNLDAKNFWLTIWNDKDKKQK